MSIYELVNEIDRGEIVLPAIQRDFVWEENRIELLFDSLFRGYPVGDCPPLGDLPGNPVSALRARPRKPGALHVFNDNSNQQRIKLVLDGQQRLSSIYVGLKGTFDGRRLYYDVLSGRDSDDHSEVKFHFWFAPATRRRRATPNKYLPGRKAKEMRKVLLIGYGYRKSLGARRWI